MTTFGGIITNVGLLVDGAVDWIEATVSAVVGSPLLSFWALLSLVGVGIGLYRRIAH